MKLPKLPKIPREVLWLMASIMQTITLIVICLEVTWVARLQIAQNQLLLAHVAAQHPLRTPKSFDQPASY